MKTASSTTTNIFEKLRDYVTSMANLYKQTDKYFEGYINDCLTYKSIYEKHGGKKPEDSSVFEIGYGAKPLRLFILDSLGYRIEGIDMDAPLIKPSIDAYFNIFKNNGFERFIKSVARNLVFDRRHYAKLSRLMQKTGFKLNIDQEKLLVGDASKLDFTVGTNLAPYDLIFSDDVFEHIPSENIPPLLSNLSTACHESTLLLIKPNIFTGITGGHLKEWYHNRIYENTVKRSEPWEHLRKDRFRANTYLNRLWRKDYRSLFSENFQILEEIVMKPNLGQDLFVGKTKSELIEIPEDELFSNQVIFVLRPRK